MRRAPWIVAAAGCALLTACGAAGGSTSPTWSPGPGDNPSEGPGAVRISPIVPGPPAAGGGSGSSGPSASPSPSPSGTSDVDPNVVATKLSAPVGLTMMPDGTALVGERTTGRIVRVQPVAGKPVPTVRTITGIDPAGDGGLLDLALSPDYAQDNLIYAYVSTKTDNRVVEFTLTGPVTPVLTGIPHGATGNAGRIAFDATGDLYVGTGDAGRPSLAADPKSLAGKVLRVDAIGAPASGNPTAGSRVFTSGHAGVTGLCPVPASTTVLSVEPGTGAGEVDVLRAGANYGFPAAAAGSVAPVSTLPASTPIPGDCALTAEGRLYVTSLDGKSLLGAAVTGTASAPKVGTYTPELANKYGRLRTVVAASDGALWLTTSNRDGKGKPVADDERVIRYLPAGGGKADSPL